MCWRSAWKPGSRGRRHAENSLVLPDSQTFRYNSRMKRAAASATSRVGKRGTVVLPARLRRRFKIEEGDTVIAEESADGILIRPALVVPLEVYSAQRKAEFLLENAVDSRDYAGALEEVRRLGVDPRKVSHRRPKR